MSPVLEANVSAKPVEYAHILALDTRLRDFYVPPELDMFGPEGLSNVRPMIVQQMYASTGREIGEHFVNYSSANIDSPLFSRSSAPPKLFHPSIEQI